MVASVGIVGFVPGPFAAHLDPLGTPPKPMGTYFGTVRTSVILQVFQVRAIARKIKNSKISGILKTQIEHCWFWVHENQGFKHFMAEYLGIL
jgi:hypothetical protein